jgi:glycosyltransferase involved in cell wall biosynthesis
MLQKSILVLTHRNLDDGGGASYRTIYIAKYLSNFFRVFIIDAQKNTYIIANHGFLLRKTQKRSMLSILLRFIPLIFNRILPILRFPKEEVGRITSSLDLSIFYDALRVGLRVRPFIIIIEEYYSLAGIASFLKKIIKAKRLVLNLHNVDTLRLSRYPDINKTFIKLIFMFEKKASNIADLVTVVSNRDLYLVKSIFNINHLLVVPNFVPYSELEHAKHEELKDLSEITSSSYVVFHGDFRYFPNREALFILVRQIMPKIWERYPSIKLIVMGPGLPRISEGRIMLMGYVPQMIMYKILCNACCAIIPLLRGGGSRIKILEYMACGIPVISTRIGAEGLEVENFKHIILVNSIDEIPSMFRMLIENSNLREKIRHNATTLVRESYDMTKVMGKFVNMCFQWVKLVSDEYEIKD